MIRRVFFILLAGVFCLKGFAQDEPQEPKVYNVAILAPIYLDSAFSGGTETSLNRMVVPGLDFIQGVEVALDTLNTKGKQVRVHVIDVKDESRSLDWQMEYGGLDKMDLIIGSVREPEFSKLSAFATANQIPFVSVTYPNDGGIRNNPFTVIVNSTLKTNIDGIYSYLVQNYGTQQIVMIRPKGDRTVESFFNAANNASGTPLLKIRSLELDSITPQQLGMLIDTTKPTVVIGASLNQEFALNLADACAAYRNYGLLKLIGMPNWDGFRGFYQKDRFTGFPIYISTPHTDGVRNAYSDFLDNLYFTRYRVKASDMAYKGFEAAYYFINILLNYPDDFFENLNRKEYAPFHEFNFRSEDLDKNAFADFFENKHISIVRIMDGKIEERW
ncbi:MAG: ABC transporter substrate-binding protein [Chitinophagaceae bacterium]|nr:ABC transporter substrate-binding protein [Chitinophagaceae bacterium]